MPGCTSCYEGSYYLEHYDCATFFETIDWDASFVYDASFPYSTPVYPNPVVSDFDINHDIRLVNLDGSLYWQPPFLGYGRLDLRTAVLTPDQTTNYDSLRNSVRWCVRGCLIVCE